MYLQDALKDGPARFVIQRLSRTSESYEEAIKCLKEWYDHPRLVQEERIRNIVDAVPVKNSSDKELRRLYDIPPFLELYARHCESVFHSGHKQASGSDRKLPVKQSFALTMVLRD